MNDNVKSAAWVLDILELLFRSEEPMALKDLVSILALPKSSAHALLWTLQLRGYVERDAADRYVLNELAAPVVGLDRRARGAPGGRGAAGDGPVARRPGRDRVPGGPRGARRRQGHRQVGQSRADPLRFRRSWSAAGLLHRDGPGSAGVLGQEVDRCLFGAHATARPHAANGDRPGKLRAILAKVAADGYAVLEEEFVLGGSATAAPVLGGDGTIVAALNVGTVSARYAAGKPRIIAGVVRAAATIGQRLGYRRAA